MSVEHHNRLLKLLGIVGGSREEPSRVLEQFNGREISDARKLAFEGGYTQAHFSLSALELCRSLSTSATLQWFYIPGSRPAHNTIVWVSYLYENEPTVDKAFLDAEGWWLDGADRIKIEPYAWREYMPAAARVQP